MNVNYEGERFATMSNKHGSLSRYRTCGSNQEEIPQFQSADISSSLSTTALLHDKEGGPIMARHAYSKPDVNQSPTTPFVMGSGFVNGTAALDAGLLLLK